MEAHKLCRFIFWYLYFNLYNLFGMLRGRVENWPYPLRACPTSNVDHYAMLIFNKLNRAEKFVAFLVMCKLNLDGVEWKQ